MYEIKVTDLDCQICGKTFDKKRGLSQHIYQTHHVNIKDYYDIYYKRQDEGICLYCGNETSFLNITNGYRLYCCRKCTDSDINKHNKTKQTFLSNYGVDSIFKIEEIHNKGVLKAQSESAILKRKQTNKQKYGVENPFGSIDIVKKIAYTKTITGNRSSLELYMETKLKEKMIDYEIEHNDELYPYNCDFYLLKTKCYIEIHNWWYHNKHFFDKNNENDILILQQWEEKAKTSQQYKRAIEFWTKRDIQKRDIAIKNNLNYIVLWNKTDIDNFIQNL